MSGKRKKLERWNCLMESVKSASTRVRLHLLCLHLASQISKKKLHSWLRMLKANLEEDKNKRNWTAREFPSQNMEAQKLVEKQ